jgi:hypothetical protein
MMRTFHCTLVGGPFDGDEGWVRDDVGGDGPPETIWAGHCKPVSECREIHWTLDHVQAANLGYERYGYERTISNPITQRPVRHLHVYVCADMGVGPHGSVHAEEDVPAYA